MARLLVISLLFLTGCGTISLEPETGLSKVSFETYQANAECTGKGILPERITNRYAVKNLPGQSVFISSGSWTLNYSTQYQKMINGECDEVIRVGSPLILVLEVREGSEYKVYLNEAMTAEVDITSTLSGS